MMAITTSNSTRVKARQRVTEGRWVAHSCAAVRLKWVCFHKQSHHSVIGDRQVRRLFLILQGRAPVSRTGPVVPE